MNYYSIVAVASLGAIFCLEGCQFPPSSSSSDECQVKCSRTATNAVEKQECLDTCRKQGKAIRSMTDRSLNFYNGLAVKNPMNERNTTASLA